MISAVRNVSFGDSAQDLINAEGKYNAQPKIADMPSDSFENKKSNDTAIKAGIGIVGLLAATFGLGYAASKGKINLEKVKIDDIEGTFAKLSARAKNAGKSIAEQAKKLYEGTVNLFSSKATAKAEDAAEGAAEGAAEAAAEGAAEAAAEGAAEAAAK